MNYFQLFDICPNLQIDKEILETKFYALCRTYHPDAQNHNANMLTDITEINTAYEVLKNENKRLLYFLNTFYTLKDGDEKEVLDKAFLMEMLELNERIEEAKESTSAQEDLLTEFHTLQHQLEDEVKHIFVKDNQINRINETEMQQLKTYYLKRKYLDRMLAQFYSSYKHT